MLAPSSDPLAARLDCEAPMCTSDRTADSTFDRVAVDLTHRAFPELADALRDRTESILKEWRTVSLRAMPHLEALTLEEFENTIAVIFSTAADAFQSSNPQRLRGMMDESPSHGVDRFVQEYSLLDLFEEVRLLRGVVIVELAEEMKRPLSSDEAATFHAIFDIIIQQGVITMVARQAEELVQSHATMREMNGQLMKAVVEHNELLAQAKAMQEQIAEQATRLMGEARRKDEFLAMLSHELRNPLAPIRSAVHLLKLHEQGAASPIQTQAREVIERQVGHLTKLVSDLLEVSRVTSGRIRLEMQTLDLNQVVRHAVETVTPLIEKYKHTLTLRLDTDALDGGVWVSGDAIRLEEVFINLLVNAAKYTPNGGVIEVRCERSADATHALMRVRDNGVGIDKGLLPRIFDLFTQADRSLDRSEGGLGIGLSLVRGIVHLHGGTVAAHSPPEDSGAAAREGAVGSEFIVELPLASPPPEVEPRIPDSEVTLSGEGIRVLMIDDNIDLVLMVASTLRLKGYSVQTSHNGVDGLKIAQQWRPDVVLLDIGLPGLNGYEVAKQIRADAATSGARLIALTGYGRDTDLALAREAGFDARMTKPIDFLELEKTLHAPKA